MVVKIQLLGRQSTKVSFPHKGREAVAEVLLAFSKRQAPRGQVLKWLLGSVLKTTCIPKEFYNILKSLGQKYQSQIFRLVNKLQVSKHASKKYYPWRIKVIIISIANKSLWFYR